MSLLVRRNVHSDLFVETGLLGDESLQLQIGKKGLPKGPVSVIQDTRNWNHLYQGVGGLFKWQGKKECAKQNFKYFY